MHIVAYYATFSVLNCAFQVCGVGIYMVIFPGFLDRNV